MGDGRGRDQVGDRLGLQQIEPTIQVGTQRELARPGDASALPMHAFSTASTTTGLPCVLISAASSPVYECGAGKVVTIADSARPSRESMRVSVAILAG